MNADGEKRVTKWAAVVAAAGCSKRFSNDKRSKLFVDIVGRPLIYHTLSNLITQFSFNQIVLVVPAAETDHIRKNIIERYFSHLSIPIDLVAGGAQRGDSVYQGLLALKETQYVAIHDGARPLISKELLTRLVKVTEKMGSAVPGLLASDTLKQTVKDNYIDLDHDSNISMRRINTTLNREQVWTVQTPQCFRYTLIKEAYEWAHAQNIVATDDAALVESMGNDVYLIEGDPDNIKITFSSDLKRITDEMVNPNLELH